MTYLASEQTINIFKLQALCFWEEEKDYGHPGCVQYSKDDISAPADVADGRRSNLDDYVIADPISSC